MLLIANGCSHTSGAEIEYSFQGECFVKAWPKKLCDKFSFEKVINLAISGASDDRVSRTTIELIGKLKQKSFYDPSKLFVVISWPGLYRTEIFKTSTNEGGFWDNGWMPMVAGNDETYKEQCTRSAYIFYKSWLMRLNVTQETVRFYSNVLLLQNFLKLNNIKYLFWNACGNLPANNSAFYNEIDINRFPFITEKEYSYTNILHTKGFKHSEVAKYGHYGEDAQEWFADFLYKYINKNKLL